MVIFNSFLYVYQSPGDKNPMGIIAMAMVFRFSAARADHRRWLERQPLPLRFAHCGQCSNLAGKKTSCGPIKRPFPRAEVPMTYESHLRVNQFELDLHFT